MISSDGGGHDHESGGFCQTPRYSLRCWSRCGGGGGHGLPRGCAPHAPCSQGHLHVVQLHGEFHARTMQNHLIKIMHQENKWESGTEYNRVEVL